MLYSHVYSSTAEHHQCDINVPLAHPRLMLKESVWPVVPFHAAFFATLILERRKLLTP
jgi:hypothetical protein